MWQKELLSRHMSQERYMGKFNLTKELNKY